jgi:RNA polymerase sigma-70 factor (ECF subfamily)
MSAAWYGQNARTGRETPDEREVVSTERTDAELLLASREDPDSFTELYRRHAEDILRYFARRTLDLEAAAELTAETFAQAFASRQTFTDTGVNGVAWLYGVARHQLGRFFRAGHVDSAARRRLGMPERPLPPDDYERIEDLVDFVPIKDALAEALETLSKDQREALKLHVIDGLAYAEVARRLACTEDNARQRVSRGLQRLAIVLQEPGDDRARLLDPDRGPRSRHLAHHGCGAPASRSQLRARYRSAAIDAMVASSSSRPSVAPNHASASIHARSRSSFWRSSPSARKPDTDPYRMIASSSTV